MSAMELKGGEDLSNNNNASNIDNAVLKKSGDITFTAIQRK